MQPLDGAAFEGYIEDECAVIGTERIINFYLKLFCIKKNMFLIEINE